MKTFCAPLLLLACGSPWAHEGHGFAGNHWHATDLWGFVVGAAAAGAAALWWRGRR